VAAGNPAADAEEGAGAVEADVADDPAPRVA
jgi:hypothetical protein